MGRELLSNAATALRMAVILGLVLVLGGACVEVAGTESPSMGVRVSPMPIVSPTPDVARVVQWGRRLADQHGCSGCHSIDGRELVGPTWLNLYGSEVEIEDGGFVLADEEYILESIREPGAKIVKDFFDLMPKLEVPLNEIDALVEYIKSIS